MSLVDLDPVVRDSRRAGLLYGLGVALLLLGAVLGLNAWPAQALFNAALSGQGAALFVAYHGYAMLVVILFWASRPQRVSQWAVMLCWPVVSGLLWWQLDPTLNIGGQGPESFSISMFLTTAMSLPCLVALAWRSLAPLSKDADPIFERRVRWLTLLALLFLAVPGAALKLTETLHPVTFDVYALLWDRAVGLNFTPQLNQWISTQPLVSELAVISYRMTPMAFLAVAMLHLRGRAAHIPTALLAWVVITTCALVAYHGLPITGPKYVFGSEHFERALSNSMSHPVQLVSVPPYPRNGMPSMHFGWMLAATILWWWTGTRWWSRLLLVTMTGFTALATLYLGEHYVIDLIVAVPFVLAGLALSTTQVPWQHRPRWGTVALGFGTWLIWICAIRWFTESVVAQPFWCALLIAATVAAVIIQIRWMRQFKLLVVPVGAAPLVQDGAAASGAEVPAARPAEATDLQRKFGLLFFVSGVAALTYQVLFAKELALVFGSTATATFTVLATFLGGMALGSLLGGHLANRVQRPLVTYAFIEVGIAVYCALTPKLFAAVQWAYVALASGMPPDASVLLPLRVAMGALVLLVPTVLMGATLPLLAQALAPAGGRMGLRVAWLYFANTAGAALGAVVTAYLIIPALGGHRTTLVAALLNLLVALGALELAKRLSPGSVRQASAVDLAPDDARAGPGFTPGMRALALLTLGVGGLLSLGLEVVYVHMLSIVAGNSVYAFGLMVATFLTGLCLGGEAARRWMMRRGSDPLIALAVSLVGLCVTVALGAGWWNGIPEYFGSFAGYPLAQTFVTREAIRGLICAALMVPPTLFIGAAYAFGMDIATSGTHRPKALLLGRAAAVNTAGNIAGVLLFGFVLLPQIGGLAAGQWIAVGALILAGLSLVVAGRARAGWLAWCLLPGLVAIGVGQRWTLDYAALSSGANVYFLPQNFGSVIDHAESIDGGLTTVTRTDAPQGPVLTLLTNGKFQGNNAMGGEMQAQIGFAMAPLLHTERRDHALVIGYGTGVTSRVLSDAGFKALDVAELSGDIVRLADQHFANVNDRVSSRLGVRMNLTDGRNLLLLRPDRYDLISIEITSIWFAGAASLYNKEFYQLARSRLQADGVLQQWVQLHRLSPMDILSVVSTLRSEFRYVSLYVMGGQGILVASNSASRAEPSPAAIERLQQQPGLAPMREVLGRPAASLPADRLLDPAGVDRLLADATPVISAWWSTDNNMLLEYQTPKANVNDPAKSYAANLAWLQRAAAPRP